MQRRTLIKSLLAAPTLALIPLAPLWARSFQLPAFEPLNKPTDEWKALLPRDRFRILFEEATERPHSSPLDKENREGIFVCAACSLPLFLSEHKFDSRTGWPSFTMPIDGAIGTKDDYLLFVKRTEYHCARCRGHQGHLFNDGPAPRGERWCNNGLALLFIPTGEPLPALRS